MKHLKTIWIIMSVLALLVSSAVAQSGGGGLLAGGSGNDVLRGDDGNEASVGIHCETDQIGKVCYLTAWDEANQQQHVVAWCEYPANGRESDAMICASPDTDAPDTGDTSSGGSHDRLILIGDDVIR